MLNLTLDIKDGKVAEAREKIDHMLTQFPLHLNVVSEGHKVQVGLKMPSPYQLPVD